VPLGLADILVEQLGAFDVEEVRPSSSPVFSETFFANDAATALAIMVLPQPGGP
jgi:hypothetical protein